MIYPWVIRTPFTKETIATWKNAQEFFRKKAEDLGVEITWYKGRGKLVDETRYHYWLVNDEKAAMTFYLAVGDEIYQQGQRGKK